MKTSILFMLMLISSLGFAQSNSSLSGHLKYKDGLTAKDITVSLIRFSDSVLVQRLNVLEDGYYLFKDLKPGTYVIVFTSLGIREVKRGPIPLKNESLVLDTILLNRSIQQLQEVSIKSTQPLIQRSIDKTILNVEHTSLAIGNTALDLLNRAPGLTVLNDGTIQLNGKQGVTVMLDGKLTYLSSSQLTSLLRNTNSSQIKSIEIMTHPPVKYDASGSAGLINIILKKNKELGSNGTITADGAVGKYIKANTGFSINQRSKKLNVYGNYNYADNKRYGILNLDRAANMLGNLSNIVQQSNSTTTNHNHTYKAGLDYNFDKNNTVGLVVAGYTNDQDEIINNKSFINHSVTQPSQIIALNKGKNSYSNIAYNLNYKSLIDTLGQQIDIDLALLNYNNAEQVIYENNFFDENGNPGMKAAIFRNISPTDLKIKALTINYTLPLSKTSTVDIGLKSSLVKTDNDFLVENKEGNSWLKDFEQSNRFRYKELINAAYLNLNKDLPGFNMQLGVRAEHTSTKGNSITMAEVVKREYLDLFPVITFSKKINKDNTVSLTANSRIDRPNYGTLNPFIYYLDLYTYKRGNPDLKPQYTNSLSFNYILRQKYGLQVAYSHTKDVITDIIKPDTVRKALFTSPENLARQNSISLSLSIPLTIASFWTMYNDLSAYHVNFYSNNILGTTYNSNQNAMNFKSYSTFSLSKNFSFDLSYCYQSRQLFGTSYLKSFSFVDAGTSYKFFGNRLNAKLSVKDIFNKKTQIIYSNLPGLNYTMYDKPETRIIVLGLSYSFGGKEVRQPRRRSTGIEEEKSRIGGIR
ncbi:outer membrane beta-barrel family protein [Pedobacter cryoconitis]|uniref:Outer membrane receptor protein involved in Fe transport n=1 Tax=Pedobacter cryoconitis TaxID=188932 RepID=A0A327T8R4_9SPHI|nr:outer membrane beta-barrel family protein [Pedobacter cryoconitis]RAJ37332.1 outer membrane receptor protein involved in Fe transport [Pedobacter cryoconitis]